MLAGGSFHCSMIIKLLGACLRSQSSRTRLPLSRGSSWPSLQLPGYLGLQTSVSTGGRRSLVCSCNCWTGVKSILRSWKSGWKHSGKWNNGSKFLCKLLIKRFYSGVFLSFFLPPCWVKTSALLLADFSGCSSGEGALFQPCLALLPLTKVAFGGLAKQDLLGADWHPLQTRTSMQHGAPRSRTVMCLGRKIPLFRLVVLCW